ncbi:PQQ-dependent sugar dehydrogenase [Haloarchaeobius salinus]|uniref:PQQ-dependent sugar dehydrogenase n=1 Tax=Haloarchaeobius salinus TaxID=1198298 RepID=UPI00210DCC6B|nr:PQQ-dependent sugar dehydrogenase [Haloarchaeobius salinus]
MKRRRLLTTVGVGLASGVAGCLDPPGDGEQTPIDEDAPLRLERVRMRLQTPWGASFHPETGSLFVTERPGRVVRATGNDLGPVGDLTGDTAAYGQAGLLGLAFDPTEPTDLYVYQTYDGENGLRNRVLRLDASRQFAVDSVVLDGIPGNTVSNGGRIAFGPEGALWVTTGDAGEPQNAQSRVSLAGKVLRVTRDGEAHPDNPFDSLVYTYGHRNPRGLTFADDAVYVVENTPDRVDELNRLERGGNYGWPEVAGAADDDRFVDPVLSWQDPLIGPGSITHYTGPIDRWRDSFFVGALTGTHLRQVTFGDGDPEQRTLYSDLGRIRTTFTGPDDHLYFTTSNQDGRGDPDPTDDEIYRVRPP